MQVSVEKGDGLERNMLVDLPAEQVDAEVNKRLQQLSKQVRLDGFRPGKVPMRVIKQRFGEQVKQEAYGELIQTSYYKAVNQEGLKPAGEPKIELRDEDGERGFGYSAKFEVMPEVELADFSGISVVKPLAEVQDTDIDAMVEKLKKQRTIWNDVDRAAQDGDTVHIDFKGMIDGEAFEGGSAENVPLVLGSGAMIPGFEDGLVGASADEERTLEVSFPEDYQNKEVAGKPSTFEVKVLKVSEPTLPEIDEDFVKAFGVEDGTEASFMKEIRGNMERELSQKMLATTKERALDALLGANDLIVPGALVSQEAERLKQQAQNDMAQAGQTSSIDLPLSIFESQAERRVKLGMLVAEIVSKNDLTVDQDRVRRKIEDLASTYEDPEEVVHYYLNDANQKAGIDNLVLEDQVVDWLLDQMQVTDEQTSFDEIMGNNK